MDKDARFQSLLLYNTRSPEKYKGLLIQRNLSFFQVPGKGALIHVPQCGPYG